MGIPWPFEILIKCGSVQAGLHGARAKGVLQPPGLKPFERCACQVCRLARGQAHQTVEGLEKRRLWIDARQLRQCIQPLLGRLHGALPLAQVVQHVGGVVGIHFQSVIF